MSYFLALVYLSYQELYLAFPPGWARTAVQWVLTGGFFYIPVALVYLAFFGRQPVGLRNLVIGLVVGVFMTEVLLALFLVLTDIGLGARALVGYLLPGSLQPLSPGGRQLIQQAALVVAVASFGSFLYGITRGKYHYQVHRVPLQFPDLPPAFHGFRVAQISDVHAGSFDNIAKVKEGLELVAAQHADLIVFTGDLVNGRAEEILPYTQLFHDILRAPSGQYAVMGNHDYGHTHAWPSAAVQRENTAQVKANYAACGFELLNNRSVAITKGGDSIQLVGVENWGRPPFPQYGDLNAALHDVPPEAFKILLSHDPTHWDLQVLPHAQHIHLTLAGHTHGMQMGVSMFGFQWSPIKYFYPRWSGLYEVAQQYLYVNRGFGWLGFPGRVGMFPEITVFELLRAPGTTS